MTVQQKELPDRQAHLKFVVAVFDGCAEAESAVVDLLESGLVRENIQMFYDHFLPAHAKSHGLRSSRLQVTLEYLEDLMGLDVSISREYEGHWRANRHVLLVNVYGEGEARGVAARLNKSDPHAGRILGYCHTAGLLMRVN